MKLNAVAFGLACGLLWTISVLILGLLAMQFGYGSQWVELIATVYKGYGPTLQGTLAGLPWAFADAYIGGFLLAWLYNKCAH